MEKAVHSRPVSEEDEALISSKKLKFEPSPAPEDTEKYTPFTDYEYKLPLYLSEFAVGEFNRKKKASYENVNVVETMKSSDVDKGTTYLVTFEASLHESKSKNARTFQTSIFMSPLEPSTKIEIKFVRMMASGFDDNEGGEFEEKDSESKEEGSEEVESSEEEEDSEETDEEDHEEELPKSDGEDTEEKLDVRKTVGGKSPRQEIRQNDIEVEKSDKEDSEEELSDKSDEEDEEEKLTESDKKSTERKVARRITFGGKGPRKHPKHDEEMKQYCIDLEKSDGFEVGIYPHVMLSCCMTRSYYDPPHRIISAASLNGLVCLSQLAICDYNLKQVTYYDNVKVLKAMDSGCGGRTYNITFEASLSDGNAVTFQARIWKSLPFPYHKIEIKFVRIKPSVNFPDITN